MAVVIKTKKLWKCIMKKVVLVGGGKKSLILEILKKNSKNEEDLEIVSKEERTNKIIVKTKKLIETDSKVFLD